MLTYFLLHRLQLLSALVEHVEISVTALFFASVLALPIGYWLAGMRKFSDIVLAVLGLLYSIPSMALLVLFVPVFGLGNVSAVVVLVLYAQFILVRSVVLGFRSIDPSVVEAARGMGLSTLQRFSLVEFPVALPVLIGGLRVAASSVISIASIAAWINAGGLGNILFEGIYQNRIEQLFWGTAMISCLALVSEFVLRNIENRAALESRGFIPIQGGALPL